MKSIVIAAASMLTAMAANAAGDPQVLSASEMKALAGRPVVIVAPKYPPDAEKEHVEATVDVIGVVAADGQFLVNRLEAVPDRDDFKQAVLDVVSYWKLVPSYGLLDCEPQLAEAQVRVWFEFKKGRSVISVSRSVPSPAEANVMRANMKAVKRVEPKYPAYGIRQEMQGRIEALVLIGEDGDVKDVRIAPTALHAVFGNSVRSALQQWKFDPRPGQGALCTYYEINFRLH